MQGTTRYKSPNCDIFRNRSRVFLFIWNMLRFIFQSHSYNAESLMKQAKMRARICTGAEWEGQVQNSLAHFKQAVSETRTGLNEDSVLVWIWHISDRDPKNQIEYFWVNYHFKAGVQNCLQSVASTLIKHTGSSWSSPSGLFENYMVCVYWALHPCFKVLL